MSNIITCVRDRGYLHLGYGDENSVGQKLGSSINVYTNCFTKLFAKIFGISTVIAVNGKKYSVEKKSLAIHLDSLGLGSEQVNEVAKIGYETLIMKNADKLKLTGAKFGENLSNQKRTRLFRKMVAQIVNNNTHAAKKMVRKGAYTDSEFFVIRVDYLDYSAIHSRSLWFDWSSVKSTIENSYSGKKFQVYSYTPLALVAEKGNQTLAQFLLKAKGGDLSSDKKLTYLWPTAKNPHAYKVHAAQDMNVTSTESEKVEPVIMKDKDIQLNVIA